MQVTGTRFSYTVAGKPNAVIVPSEHLQHKVENLCSASEYAISATVLFADGAVSEAVTVTFTTLDGNSRCGKYFWRQTETEDSGERVSFTALLD